MKRIIALVVSVFMLTPAFCVSAVAPEASDEVCRYTPAIDGIIDDAYLRSYRIEHEWVSCWGLGKYEEDNGKNSYGWDVKATSYFLWDDRSIYLAVKVVDDDIGVIDDEHFSKAIADRTQWGPFYQDGIMAYFEFDGMLFEIHADGDGKMATVYAESNYNQIVWAYWYSFPQFERNAEDGLWAFQRTSDGYVLEFDIPVHTAVRDAVFENGFNYGIAVGDSTADSGYDYDYALSLEGIYQEGVTLSDTIFVYDLVPPYNDWRKYQVYFSDREIYDYGDINGDGSVDIRDLVRLMKYVAAGADSDCGIFVTDADTDGDGITDIKDVVHLMKTLSGESD